MTTHPDIRAQSPAYFIYPTHNGFSLKYSGEYNPKSFHRYRKSMPPKFSAAAAPRRRPVPGTSGLTEIFKPASLLTFDLTSWRDPETLFPVDRRPFFNLGHFERHSIMNKKIELIMTPEDKLISLKFIVKIFYILSFSLGTLFMILGFFFCFHVITTIGVIMLAYALIFFMIYVLS
ncbi:MAG TPA: hypothetical protein ENH82_10885 [bacterium]|nr:hypothetical protein [bacterium]